MAQVRTQTRTFEEGRARGPGNDVPRRFQLRFTQEPHPACGRGISMHAGGSHARGRRSSFYSTEKQKSLKLLCTDTLLFFSTFLFTLSSPGFTFVQPDYSDISTVSLVPEVAWSRFVGRLIAYFLALPGPDQGFFLVVHATVASLEVRWWYVLLACYCSIWRATGLQIKTCLISDFASQHSCDCWGMSALQNSLVLALALAYTLFISPFSFIRTNCQICPQSATEKNFSKQPHSSR